MDNTQQPIEEKIIAKQSNASEKLLLRNRFWLLGTLSLLFLITFVYYLPLRFEHQAVAPGAHSDMADHGDHEDAGEDIHAGHALPELSSLEDLQIRTPANRVQYLPFIEKDGVKEFRLSASEFRWEYEPGKWVHAWGYNGQIPGPEIRVNEGDSVRVIVENNLPDSTTVHWHGLDVPWQFDGVANVTQEAIAPGGEYTYEFDAIPSGTRFYHSHGKNHITAAQQMDMGLSGAFIVDPAIPAYSFDKEFTLVLDEWDILDGVNPAIAHVHGAATPGAIPEYNTFTINGRIFPYIDALTIQEGDRVLIRFINAGTTAFHPMHLHGHSFDVVAKDGFPIQKSAIETHNTITLHPGETVDILVQAENPGPWLLHCHHVHHASAGMITLLQYEGYKPISSKSSTMTDFDSSMITGDNVHAHPSGTPDDHTHAPVDISTNTTGDDHHAHPTGTPEDHAHAPVASSESGAWWGLLLVSAILIVLLSMGVNKFLKGDE